MNHSLASPPPAPRCATCGYLSSRPGACPQCLARLAGSGPPADATEVIDAEAYDHDELRAVAEQIPGMVVLERIGRGGMGVVYRAKQARLDRPVALKLLALNLVEETSLVRRFEQEARAMAVLDHPGIVKIHDVDVVAGHPYLVLEFVDGPSLRDVLATGPLAPAQALALAVELCEALHFAHTTGVIHRDLKPENLLLTRDGRLKIADFGLAKVGGPRQGSLTGDQVVLGSPRYMAPEQWEDARAADPRSDVFAVGVILYEMLTGQLPTGRFDPPSTTASVDHRTDAVVLKALDHAPERRYQSGIELLHAISLARAPATSPQDPMPIAPAGPPAPPLGVQRVEHSWASRTLRLDVAGQPPRILRYENRMSAEVVLLDGEVVATGGDLVNPAFLLAFELPVGERRLRACVETRLQLMWGRCKSLRLTVDGHQLYGDGTWLPRGEPGPAPAKRPHTTLGYVCAFTAGAMALGCAADMFGAELGIPPRLRPGLAISDERLGWLTLAAWWGLFVATIRGRRWVQLGLAFVCGAFTMRAHILQLVLHNGQAPVFPTLLLLGAVLAIGLQPFVSRRPTR